MKILNYENPGLIRRKWSWEVGVFKKKCNIELN